MSQGLSGRAVQAWLEDREGNVWAGTSDGLDHFRRTKLTRVELPG
jgi:ligand-binding sensor domain-containing protein